MTPAPTSMCRWRRIITRSLMYLVGCGAVLQLAQQEEKGAHRSTNRNSASGLRYIRLRTATVCRRRPNGRGRFAMRNSPRHASSPGAKRGRHQRTRATTLICQHANWCRSIIPKFDDGYASTAPVGTFAPNALGIYDGGGNVAEWVNDWYTVPTPGMTEPVVDPTGPRRGTSRVIRGSSWRHAGFTELRLSYRDYG